MIGFAGEPTADFWLGLAVAILVGLAPVVVLLASLREDNRPRQAPPRSPIDVLQERYAQGEITAGEYQDMLIELLNDSYARGQLRLNEYQMRLDQMLREAHAESAGDARLRERAHQARMCAESSEDAARSES